MLKNYFCGQVKPCPTVPLQGDSLTGQALSIQRDSVNHSAILCGYLP
jgi:hypothetical protein